MTPKEIQDIAFCLRKRVKPIDAEEGAALFALAHKLVSHFAQKSDPPQDLQKVVTPTPPPHPTPDPTPPPPREP